MFQIDKNVELPPAQEVVAKQRYPFDVMNPGDSFLVPTEEGKTGRQLMQRISPSISRYAAKTGRKFTTRIVDEGVRVWRLPDEVTASVQAPPPPPPIQARQVVREMAAVEPD